MDLNKLTLKSQEALQAAQEQAARATTRRSSPRTSCSRCWPTRRASSIALLHALGQSPRALRDRAEELLDRMPKVYGGQEVGLSPATRHVLERAFTEAASLTDEYVSTEHLFLALLEGGTDGRACCRTRGWPGNEVLEALAEVRGRQRVTDQNPEEKYQALERYGRDLTDAGPARASSTRSSAATTRSAG